MNTSEKIIYENELGESIEISHSLPFFLEEITGIDGIKNEIHRYKAVGQDGTTIEDKSLDEREINIIGKIRGTSRGDVLYCRRKLIRIFNPKLKGKLKYSYGGIIKEIDVEVEESPVFAKSNVWRVQRFMINLLGPDPFLLDIYESGELIQTWIKGFQFPLKLPFQLRQRGETKKNIYNEGDVETPVEIIFKGPAVNPSVTNLTTNEFIKVKRTLTSDDTLYITTERGNKKVEIKRGNGERENAFHYIDLDSTFFSLQAGDNLIEYNTENLEPQSVEIRYRNRYLGM